MRMEKMLERERRKRNDMVAIYKREFNLLNTSKSRGRADIERRINLLENFVRDLHYHNNDLLKLIGSSVQAVAMNINNQKKTEEGSCDDTKEGVQAIEKLGLHNLGLKTPQEEIEMFYKSGKDAETVGKLKEDIFRMQRKEEKLREELCSAMDVNMKYHNSILELQSENAQLKEAVDELDQKLFNSQDLCESLESRLKLAEQTIKLEKQEKVLTIDSFAKYQQSHSYSDIKVTQLTQCIEDTKAKLQDLQTVSEQKRQELQNLTCEFHQAKARLHDTEESKVLLCEERKVLRKVQQELENKVKDLEEENSRLKLLFSPVQHDVRQKVKELRECQGALASNTKQMRIQLLEAYVKDLNEQNDMLVQMVEEAAQTKEELCHRDKQRTQQLNRAKDALCQAQDELECERENNVTLSCEISALKNENSRLCRLNEDAQKEISVLNETLSEQECLIKKTRKDICELESEMNRATKDLQELENKLCKSMNDNDRLKQTLRAAEAKHADMRDELRKAKDMEGMQGKACAKLEREIDDLQQALDQKQEEICSLEAQLNDMAKDLDCLEQKVQKLEDDKEKLCNKNAQLIEELQCVEEKARQMERENRDLAEDLERYQSTHSVSDVNYQQLESQLQNCKDRLRESQCIVEEKCQHINDLNNELCSAKEELREVCDKLKCYSDEVDNLSKTVCDLENENASLKEELNCLNKELSDADRKDQAQCQELRMKEAELKDCCDSLNRRDEEIKCLKEELHEARMEMNRLSMDLQAAERDICDMKLDKEKLKSDLSEACNMYNTLAKRTECLEKELENTQSKCDQGDSELKDLNDQLEACLSDKSYALQQVNKLELDLNAACNNIRDLNSQISEYKQKLRDAEKDMSAACKEIRSLETEVQCLESKLKECDEFNECLKERLQQSQKNAADEEGRSQQEIRRLKCELEEETCVRRELEFQIASKDQLINSLRFKC